jgi:hypothetical protein
MSTKLTTFIDNIQLPVYVPDILGESKPNWMKSERPNIRNQMSNVRCQDLKPTATMPLTVYLGIGAKQSRGVTDIKVATV